MNLEEPESTADPVADGETSRRLYGRYQLIVFFGGVGIILWLASPVFWSHYHRWQFENGTTDSRLNAEAYFIGQGAESLDYLLKRLRHPHPEVRAISAHALGQIGDRRAVQPLIEHLEDDNEERTVVEASAIALGLIGDFRAGPALMKALDGDFLFIRYYSALSLVRLTGQNIAIDRPAWESWWNDQKHLPPIPKRKRPKGSAFLLSYQQLVEKHFYKAVVGTAQDNISAILQPKWVGPEDPAIVKLLDDAQLVYGIVESAPPRALPAKLLNHHQVVNLSMGGRYTVVMAGPLGGFGTAYCADVDDRDYTFGVSGFLRNGTLVPYDHLTETFWNPIDGVGLLGPLAGKHMKRIPLVHCRWGLWKKRFPNTRILSPKSYKNGRLAKTYLMPIYPNYDTTEDILCPLVHEDNDKRVPTKEKVLGIHVGGHCRAYPVSELEKAGGLISERIGEREILVQWSRKDNLLVARYKDGSYVPAVPANWFVWYAYHPETEIFRDKGKGDKETRERREQSVVSDQ